MGVWEGTRQRGRRDGENAGMAAAGVPIEVFDQAAEASVAALRAGADKDWSVAAGPLLWSCWRTADHLCDAVFAYAMQAAGRSSRDLPFQEMHAAPEAAPHGLADGLEAVTRMLSACSVRPRPTPCCHGTAAR